MPVPRHASNRHDIVACLDAWDNRQRRHAARGYTTPDQIELTAA
jgi:hypothetical protein